MIYLIIFVVIGILNGVWALKMQKKYHPKFVEKWRMTLVFVLNFLFFIITIPWAAINKQLW